MVLRVQAENLAKSMSRHFINLLTIIAASLLAACSARDNYTGVEYGPQMYHSVPYEPLSQMTEAPEGPIGSWYYIPNSNPFNDYNGSKLINQKKPVPGTVARQYAASLNNTASKELMVYNLHKDSVDLAGRILSNPLPNDEKIVGEGKALYLSFCSACHGANGQGNGKVGEVYKGVPNYSQGRYATLPEGHVFHVITHGKGRMWSHKSQLSPEDRWKIVRYVQKLQKGES